MLTDCNCEVTLMGGGPGDGHTFIVMPDELDGLRERKVGDGYYWGCIFAVKRESVHVYCEPHPHEQIDFFPPAKLELWFAEHADFDDWFD